MKKMNNKGFSLVELIIVIAIMAILAAALAPQLMKYIEKSRISTDKSTCDSIKSCVNTATAEEAVYSEIVNGGSTVLEFSSGTTPTTATTGWTNYSNLIAELTTSLGNPWPKAKSSGATSFKISITVNNNNITNVSVDTDNGVMSK